MQNKTKKATILAFSYLGTAALAFAILAGVNYERARRYERAVNNTYQHAFDELVTAVEEVDTALQKSVYVMSPGLAGSLCTEIFGKAMTAQMSLGALPFSSQELEQTSGFISRVGDYANALSRSAAAGNGVTEEQLNNLQSLSDAASILALNLRGMQSDLQDGRLTLTELRRSQMTLDAAEDGASGETGAAYAGESIRRIEQEFPEVPSLIYDGPFSEHLTGAAPKTLEGLEEVSEGKARNIAAEFLGVSRAKVHFEGEQNGEEIPCRLYAADGSGGATAWVAVTKRGGKILSMLSSRPVGTAVVDPEEAVETAKRFLEGAGYTDMAETYHMTQGGILTANFAYRQGETICYSDLVKVSVALDTGEVCGFEARGYLTAHCWRELPEPAVDYDTALTMVPAQLEVLAAQRALVPSDGQYETLCYEFKCAAADGRHCLIYVNAQTGAQEKILILLEDESGALTI